MPDPAYYTSALVWDASARLGTLVGLIWSCLATAMGFVVWQLNPRCLVNRAIAFGTSLLAAVSLLHFFLYWASNAVIFLKLLCAGSIVLLATSLVIYDAICHPIDSPSVRVRRLWPWAICASIFIGSIAVGFSGPNAMAHFVHGTAYAVHRIVCTIADLTLMGFGIVQYRRIHDSRRIELRAFLCMMLGGICSALLGDLRLFARVASSFYTEVPVAVGFIVAIYTLAQNQRYRLLDIFKNLAIQAGRLGILGTLVAFSLSHFGNASRIQLVVGVVLAASVAMFATEAFVPWAIRWLCVTTTNSNARLQTLLERQTDLKKLLDTSKIVICEELDASTADLVVGSVGRRIALNEKRSALAERAREKGPVTKRDAAMNAERLSLVMHVRSGQHDLYLFLGDRSTIQPFGIEQLRFIEGTLILIGGMYGRLEALQLAWHRERLAYIGQALAIHTHETRNQLGGVLDVLRMLAERAEDRLSDEHRQAAVEVCEAILLDTESRLEMARDQNEEIDRVSLEGVLQDTIRLVEPVLRRSNVRLVSDLGGVGIEVLAGRRALRQVFINLLTNACDALSSTRNGVILISALKIENTAKVVVEDNGPGVPAIVHEKLFSPFTTSKESGTGLGLSFCRSVLAAMNGTIDYVTPKGQPSARFEIVVPLA